MQGCHYFFGGGGVNTMEEPPPPALKSCRLMDKKHTSIALSDWIPMISALYQAPSSNIAQQT